MALQTGQRLGGFEVIALLGAGGMGEVYRARDTRLGRDVALKTLPESVSEDRDRVARFEMEARAASALNHPHIVTIHEIGRDGGVTYVAMELVEGRTLRELMVSGAMPVRRLLNLGAQIAEGLAKAHAAGIVHRDLKPENVMVSRDGFVKILDFGLAKLIEPAAGDAASALPTMAKTETRPGTVLGTVGYMSPEQASGEPLDYRSDQFSLGTILYEMATGMKAFQRKTAVETMSAIIRDEPEPAGKVRPDLPPPVRWVIDRCLAKDRDERYASTRDLARDLAGLRDRLSEASSGSDALAASTARPRRRWAVPVGALLLAAAAVLAGRWSVRAAGPAAPVFRRLSFGREAIGNARFTSDGKTVVYGALSGQFLGAEQRLLFTRAGNPESKAFDFPGDILAISKSDEMAVFQQGPGRGGLGTLSVASVAGGSARPLVADVVWAGADWDPAGKGLAVLRSGAQGGVRLEFPLNNRLLDGRLEGVRFSRDGARLALFSEGSNGFSLVVLDRDGKNRRDVSSGWFATSGVPYWRSGGEIWFTARRQGDADSLWAATLSGGLRLVMHVPGTLELYDISSDNQVLLGHHTQIRTVRGVSPADGSEGELSWLDNSLISDLSADGTTLLITEVGAGAAEGPAIYTRKTDRSPATRVGDGWGFALSPDKQWVLANRKDGDKWHLWLVPTGAGDARSLATEGLDVTSGAFVAGTPTIVFSAEDRNGRSRLYTLETPGGKPVPIPGGEDTSISLFTSPVSPDGKRLMATRRGDVVVMPLAGGEARPIPGLSLAGYRVPQWSADSSAVYVFKPTGRSLSVELVNADTGARRPWNQIALGGDGWGQFRLRVTPDGKAWAYSAMMSTSELYVVDGLR